MSGAAWDREVFLRQPGRPRRLGAPRPRTSRATLEAVPEERLGPDRRKNRRKSAATAEGGRISSRPSRSTAPPEKSGELACRRTNRARRAYGRSWTRRVLRGPGADRKEQMLEETLVKGRSRRDDSVCSAAMKILKRLADRPPEGRGRGDRPRSPQVHAIGCCQNRRPFRSSLSGCWIVSRDPSQGEAILLMETASQAMAWS